MMDLCIVCNQVTDTERRFIDDAADHKLSLRVRLTKVLDEVVTGSGWMCFSCQLDLAQIETYYRMLDVFRQRYWNTVRQKGKCIPPGRSALLESAQYHLGRSLLNEEGNLSCVANSEGIGVFSLCSQDGVPDMTIKQSLCHRVGDKFVVFSEHTREKVPGSLGSTAHFRHPDDKLLKEVLTCIAISEESDLAQSKLDGPESEETDLHVHETELEKEGSKPRKINTNKAPMTSHLKTTASKACTEAKPDGSFLASDKCGKAFKQKICLFNHMRLHNSEHKPKPAPMAHAASQTCRYTPKIIGIHLRNLSDEDDSLRGVGDSNAEVQSLYDPHSKRVSVSKLCEEMRVTEAQACIGSGLFICAICNHSFGNNYILQRHMRIHTGERPFVCEKCGKAFHDAQPLKLHMKMHINRKKACNFCDQTFNLVSALKKHLTTHTGEGHFVCPTCGRGCTTSSGLKLHLRTHTGEKPFVCDICSKGFTQAGNLRDHIRTHSREKPFVCEICAKSFSQMSAMKRHRVVHTDERPHICDQCGKTFKKASDLTLHAKLHKGTALPCSICHKMFLSKQTLELHVRTHTDARPFECELCNKTFRQKATLKEHTRQHTGQKPPANHVCETCGKTYPVPYMLKIHKMAVHTGERKFWCDVCGKGFMTSSKLTMHIRVHTGDRPYTCDECGLSFKQGGALSLHKRTHTDKRPYPCVQCGKAFPTSSKLKRHMYTHLVEHGSVNTGRTATSVIDRAYIPGAHSSAPQVPPIQSLP